MDECDNMIVYLSDLVINQLMSESWHRFYILHLRPILLTGILILVYTGPVPEQTSKSKDVLSFIGSTMHFELWSVGCGLTSHTAIFQLYSDETVVQFPNFDLLPGTQRHRQLRVFSMPSLPGHGHRDIRRRL